MNPKHSLYLNPFPPVVLSDPLGEPESLYLLPSGRWTDQPREIDDSSTFIRHGSLVGRAEMVNSLFSPNYLLTEIQLTNKKSKYI